MDYSKKKSVSKPSICNVLVYNVLGKLFKCPVLYLELLRKICLVRTYISN